MEKALDTNLRLMPTHTCKHTYTRASIHTHIKSFATMPGSMCLHSQGGTQALGHLTGSKGERVHSREAGFRNLYWDWGPGRGINIYARALSADTQSEQ